MPQAGLVLLSAAVLVGLCLRNDTGKLVFAALECPVATVIRREQPGCRFVVGPGYP